MNWTDWHNPMTQQDSPHPLTSRQTGPSGAVDVEQTCLELLLDLEASLRSSQSALLARDMPRMELLTRKQDELHHALSTILKSGSRPGTCDGTVPAVARRVLQLGRVQCALLRRAQQSLRTSLYSAAGTQSEYGPGTPVGSINVSQAAFEER